MACISISGELNPCGLKHTGDCSGLVHNPIRNSRQAGVSSSLRAYEKKALTMYKIHTDPSFNPHEKNINPLVGNNYDAYLAKKKGNILRNQYMLNYLNQDSDGNKQPQTSDCSCNNTTYRYWNF